MPDFLTLLKRWWKMIAGFVLAIAVITAIVLALEVKQYVSTVTALPAATVNFDKSKIFSQNLQNLYSPIGSSEDIDRILGTADLDTICLQLIRENNLVHHYNLAHSDMPQYAAIQALRENVDVLKDEYSQLKISVWDKDRFLAAKLANSLFQKYQAMHQRLQSEANLRILTNLKQHQAQLQQEYVRNHDSMSRAASAQQDLIRVRNDAVIKELAEYERLINEYGLVSNTRPEVLLLVEAAHPGFKTGRPKVLPTFIMTCFVAFIFAILLSLYLDSRKKTA
jgi:hypothetical protein